MLNLKYFQDPKRGAWLIADHDADEEKCRNAKEAIYCAVNDELTAAVIVKAVNSFPYLLNALGHVTVVADALADEGDRVYLGSTNHANLLSDVRDLWWDEQMDGGPEDEGGMMIKTSDLRAAVLETIEYLNGNRRVTAQTLANRLEKAVAFVETRSPEVSP